MKTYWLFSQTTITGRKRSHVLYSNTWESLRVIVAPLLLMRSLGKRYSQDSYKSTLACVKRLYRCRLYSVVIFYLNFVDCLILTSYSLCSWMIRRKELIRRKPTKLKCARSVFLFLFLFFFLNKTFKVLLRPEMISCVVTKVFFFWYVLQCAWGSRLFVVLRSWVGRVKQTYFNRYPL